MADEKSSDLVARQITATRVFDAPRELVFDAFTKPDHVAHWWGPNGFASTIQTMDVRPGGEWTLVMHGPDGTNYPNRMIYTEITRPSRLAYQHVSTPPFDMLITFNDVGGKTEVTMCMTLATPADRDAKAKRGADVGMQQTIDRLGTFVSETDDTTFIVPRTFDAPRQRVWAAWTEPKQMAEWFGPRGSPVIKSDLDLRPGGVYHYALGTPNGGEMWGKWVFREIDPPQRLVWVSSFSDPAGGITRAPFFDGQWPMETLTVVTFNEIDGKTKVTLLWTPVRATDVERETFKSNHPSLAGGWGGTFDQLAAYLGEK
jgi:uncharacterized protein YndB with AHSA1/START domain